jgi:hypothetical protein
MTTDEAGFAAGNPATVVVPAAPGATDLLPPELTPEAASTRIVELKADPKFQEKYLSGEVGAKAEFAKLHTIVGKGPVNETGIHRASQLDAMKKHADLPPKCWEQVANNGPVFQHEREEALRTKERCMRDRSFVARYLDGSREEVSLMTQISMILASPVKTEGN